MAPAAKAKRAEVPHASRNTVLPGGVMRFTQARMHRIRKLYQLKAKKVTFKKTPKRGQKGGQTFKVKKIGGDKNGGERRVLSQRIPRLLDSERTRKARKPRNKKPVSQHTHKLRSTLTPGTVVIMLAGRHKGKRAVFLKQLKSGLLLVTGPMKLNNCPMRRINQIYVIGTKTKLDISGLKIPDNIDDKYFRREKRKRHGATKEGAEVDIFAKKTEGYTVSDQRKADQKTVDTEILKAIKKSTDKKLLFGYLGSTFSLRKNEYPHRMLF